MRWDDVLRVVGDAAVADTTLSGIYGTDIGIRLQGAAKHITPSLTIWLVDDSETELWEPCVLQFDQRTESLSDLIASERRLRQMFVDDLALTIGGVVLYGEYLDGVDLSAPTEENTYARAIRVSMEALRESLQRP